MRAPLRVRGLGAVLLCHNLIGVPLAAFLHSVLQFAHGAGAGFRPRDLWIFPLHFLLGIVVGSLVLVPAFSLQGVLFYVLTLARVPKAGVVVLCGAFQAWLVSLWADNVGIEPSLAGRFRLTPPMIGAGFVAGVAVAVGTILLAGRRRPANPQ